MTVDGPESDGSQRPPYLLHLPPSDAISQQIVPAESRLVYYDEYSGSFSVRRIERAGPLPTMTETSPTPKQFVDPGRHHSA